MLLGKWHSCLDVEVYLPITAHQKYCQHFVHVYYQNDLKGFKGMQLLYSVICLFPTAVGPEEKFGLYRVLIIGSFKIKGASAMANLNYFGTLELLLSVHIYKLFKNYNEQNCESPTSTKQVNCLFKWQNRYLGKFWLDQC